ncbi:PP2C family protein-serine/threonine phosphatase [Ruminococcus sp.]|uniref:PP2C family protein-serine/threonine phosphatase n=1 Tax=Ruminococcus sp. TaxID=41978 RepID=UPI003890C2A5
MRKNKIEYAVVSATGKVRRNNEDNYCCCGKIREDVNAVTDSVHSGMTDAAANELFAVFDGMGGEACGEVASYIAASSAMLFTRAKDAYGEYLKELAAFINDKIREGTEARSLVLMGTTAAMLQVAGEDVYILNSGDSRIYKLSSHELRQISEDHILPVRGGNAITQFLGMPEGYEPSPYAAKGKYKPGDMFLLCSDGVTDMLSDDEICRIIDDRMDVDVLVRALVDAALDKGGVDNTTALLLRFL